MIPEFTYWNASCMKYHCAFFSCSGLLPISLSYCNLISAEHLCTRYHYLGVLTMKSLQFKAINKVSQATFKNWSVSSLLTSVFINQLPFKDPIWHLQLITIMPLWWVLWESSVTTLFIKFFPSHLLKTKDLQVHYCRVVRVEEKRNIIFYRPWRSFFPSASLPLQKKQSPLTCSSL